MVKKQIKAFFAAFSMYSKIPVPQVEWDDDTLKYALFYFPLVGVAISLAMLLADMALSAANAGDVLCAAVKVVIPIAVTGGIHLDGFIDTADALASYQTKEKKLEIMSDPHIGAFAVIGLACYILLCFGLWSEAVYNFRINFCVYGGFVLSRAISGLCLVNFKKAKTGGLAAAFSDRSAKNAVTTVMLVYIILIVLSMVKACGIFAVFSITAAAGCAIIYYFTAKHNFGGVTGDTAGRFLCICELAILCGCVIGDKIL